MRRATLKRFAVGAGIVLAAAAPPVVADRVAEYVLHERADDILYHQARERLIRIEARIDRAREALDRLAADGVATCSAAHLEAMRQAVFDAVPVKEAAIVDGQGALLCSQHGFAADHVPLTAEQSSRDGAVTLSIVRVGEPQTPALRLRQVNGPPHLAVSVPIELFLPPATARAGFGIRIVVAAMPFVHAEMPADLAARDAVVSVASSRHPVTVDMARSMASLRTDAAMFVAIARASGVLVSVLIVALGWSLLRRRARSVRSQVADALEAGEIVPYYQPIVDVAHGTLLGCEVLARWIKPDGTIELPDRFIPELEREGGVLDLTVALMRTAVDDLAGTYRARPGLKVAFNVHASHFAGDRIVADLRAAFGHGGIRLDQLVVEITERAPLNDLEAARRTVDALHALGVQVAIDDVGTGHGTLNYLLELGVDAIKIDKVFIDAIGTGRPSVAIIDTLADLGRAMDIDVVAEGVETFEQLEHLRAKGVAAAQGFAFAPPLPVRAFRDLVESMQPVRDEARAEPAHPTPHPPPGHRAHAPLRRRRFG